MAAAPTTRRKTVDLFADKAKWVWGGLTFELNQGLGRTGGAADSSGDSFYLDEPAGLHELRDEDSG